MSEVKNFEWVKKGRIYDPRIEHEFIKSHAQIPTALYIPEENKIRIYFATRPYNNLSQTTFMDLDSDNPSNILYIHNKAILEFGRDGLFDEHGIMPNVVFKNGNDIYLYYIGWSRRDSIPYSNWAGLAISKDNGITFQKVSSAPILDRTGADLFSTGASDIKIENGIWRMLYVSGIDWVKANGKYEQTYSVKYASSADGIHWNRQTDIIVPQANEFEAITRPTVIKIDKTYYMWYCFRGSKDYRDGSESYRIGFAWSDDYINWHRDDAKSGITISDDGWDSRMIAYPNVIKVEKKYFMFYCGNYFGKDGFGYAELKLT